MEDQQTHADDLTEPSAHVGVPTQAAFDDTETGRPADPNPETGDSTGRLDAWLARAVAAAVLLFVGSAAFAGALLQPYLADRATAATKLEIARTAATAVTTLWTYTPDTIDTLPERAGQYLSGDFRAQYRTLLQAAVVPNKQGQVTDKTDVVGVAVESLHGPDADVLVLTNTTATSPLTHNIPSLKYVGYRLTLKQRGAQWLVTNMATISFLDLTPKI